jgi:CBS domain-containing protein
VKVAEIMQPATTISADTPVTEVAQRMLESDAPGVPVVDGAGAVVGLVTEKDVVWKHARVHVPTYVGLLGGVISVGRAHAEEDLRRALAVTAGDLMDIEFVTVSPDTEIDDAASLMVEEDADPLVVIDGDRLVGLLSHREIIRLLILEESSGGESAPA